MPALHRMTRLLLQALNGRSSGNANPGRARVAAPTHALTMNRRWLEMLPAAPVTATLMVFFQVRVRLGSSCT